MSNIDDDFDSILQYKERERPSIGLPSSCPSWNVLSFFWKCSLSVDWDRSLPQSKMKFINMWRQECLERHQRILLEAIRHSSEEMKKIRQQMNKSINEKNWTSKEDEKASVSTSKWTKIFSVNLISTRLKFSVCRFTFAQINSLFFVWRAVQSDFRQTKTFENRIQVIAAKLPRSFFSTEYLTKLLERPFDCSLSFFLVVAVYFLFGWDTVDWHRKSKSARVSLGFSPMKWAWHRSSVSAAAKDWKNSFERSSMRKKNSIRRLSRESSKNNESTARRAGSEKNFQPIVNNALRTQTFSPTPPILDPTFPESRKVGENDKHPYD